jgi:hypothetical protein
MEETSVRAQPTGRAGGSKPSVLAPLCPLEVGGIAAFSDLSIDQAGYGYSLHATVGGSLPDIDSDPFSIMRRQRDRAAESGTFRDGAERTLNDPDPRPEVFPAGPAAELERSAVSGGGRQWSRSV